jgi:ABC-type Fe3+ transport system substrate-binding protein
VRRCSLLTGTSILAMALTLAACTSDAADRGRGPAAAPAAPATDVASASSAEDIGGMEELIRAAKAEGELNVIGLRRDRVNYDEMLDAFTRTYGIKVNSLLPDASDQDVLAAVTGRQVQDAAPDVLNLGTDVAQQAAAQQLLAPYRVAPWAQIPVTQKDPGALWANDYGGYISIGCNAVVVPRCPNEMSDLLDRAYAGQVALTGDPTQAPAAFGAVWAAALVNGGSLDNVGPGIDFFRRLKAVGNFNPVQATPATIQSGEIPISIDWDYLNVGLAETLAPQGVTWKVNVPKEVTFGSFYSQAISASAPHPAAARLWEEFLYSPEGQNILLRGGMRPVLLPLMQAAGTVEAAVLAALPETRAIVAVPTQQQKASAQQVVAERWSAVMSR